MDSGLSAGMTIGSEYDPMLAKVIAHAGDRAGALRGLDRALAGTAVLGVGTNIEFLRFVLSDNDVAAGRLDTGLLERMDVPAPEAGDEAFVAAAAYDWLRRWPAGPADLWAYPSGWRLGVSAPSTIRLRSAARTDHVHITGTPKRAQVRIEGGESHSLSASLVGRELSLTLDGLRRHYVVAEGEHEIWLSGDGRTVVLQEVWEAPIRPGDEHSGDAELTSPMPGSVVAVGVSDGEAVEAGVVVVAVEAMKMEHSLRAPVAGVVELLVALGDQVKVGQPLARISAKGDDDE